MDTKRDSPTKADPQPPAVQVVAFDSQPAYRVYRRRWLGLVTLMLMNIMISWGLVIYSLGRFGIRAALLLAAGFSVLGVWLRFIGAKVNSSNGGHFAVVMLGQILIGFGQPFVLNAPAFYGDLWFTSRGRVTANALVSLSNPLGAAETLIEPIYFLGHTTN
ncbi:hypothetical protein DRE_07221 [Drechslerella stenobrocha 248]|uniref:Uncharacterized protein n=1 Tax=Drechslerella stenobrocha 248 TaxID=1043628 RepID=W7HJH5_9PEZI|nr:hypothetical protein DRE_07221 [Drechslerella stenobrocha 248]